MESDEGSAGFDARRRRVCRTALGTVLLLPGCIATGGWPSTNESDPLEGRELSIENRSRDEVTASIRITSSADSGDGVVVSETVTLGRKESRTVATVHEISVYTVKVSVESGPERTFQWPVCTGYGHAEVLIEATADGYTQSFVQAHGDPESDDCEL